MSSSGMKISPCISFQVFPMDPFTGGFGCAKEAWSLSGVCGGSGPTVRQTVWVVSQPLKYHTGVETWGLYTYCEGFFVGFSRLCSSKPSPDPCSAEGYQSWSYSSLPALPLPATSKPSEPSLTQSPSLIHHHVLCGAHPPHPQGATAVEVVLPGPCKRTTSLFSTIRNLRNYLIWWNSEIMFLGFFLLLLSYFPVLTIRTVLPTLISPPWDLFSPHYLCLPGTSTCGLFFPWVTASAAT